MKPTVEILDRQNHLRLGIKDSSGKEMFCIVATDKGIEITGLYDDGDMVIKPKSGNQIAIVVVDGVRL